MTAAPDTLLVTGPNNQQISIGTALITPTSGTQAAVADLLGGSSQITGGTINGAIIGGTTPAAATVTTLTATSTVSLSPASKAVTISPSGTGTVAISPVGALTINPTAASTMNNVVIGGSTPLAGTFTTVNGTAFTGTYFTATSFFNNSVSNALTAAGTTRADALALTTQVNRITTAAGGTGVVLPSVATAGVGAVIYVFNAGASLIKVYGAGSDTIDGTAGSTGVSLTNALRCSYTAVAAATWVSAQLGAVSA